MKCWELRLHNSAADTWTLCAIDKHRILQARGRAVRRPATLLGDGRRGGGEAGGVGALVAVQPALGGVPPPRAQALTSGTSRHSRHSRSWDSRRQACHTRDRSRSGFPTRLGSEDFLCGGRGTTTETEW